MNDRNPQPVASVVIPAHNAANVLAEQLEALCQQVDAPAFDVTVVTNRCTDDTARVAAQYISHLLPGRIVDAPNRPSAGYARNIGAQSSSGEMLLFCDADDIVDPHWVSEMHRQLVVSNADVVGGQLRIDRRAIAPWRIHAGYEALDGVCSLSFWGHRYAVTASMACKRSVFDVLGGFDEDLPDGAAAEDTDFGVRRSQAGFSFAEAPQAVVSYRPRTTVWAACQRSYRYAYNGAALSHKMGICCPPSLVKVVLAPAKSMAHAAIIRRQLDPRGILLAGALSASAHLGTWRFHRHLRLGSHAHEVSTLKPADPTTLR